MYFFKTLMGTSAFRRFWSRPLPPVHYYLQVLPDRPHPTRIRLPLLVIHTRSLSLRVLPEVLYRSSFCLLSISDLAIYYLTLMPPTEQRKAFCKSHSITRYVHLHFPISASQGPDSTSSVPSPHPLTLGFKSLTHCLSKSRLPPKPDSHLYCSKKTSTNLLVGIISFSPNPPNSLGIAAFQKL